MERRFKNFPWCRYSDDGLVHCQSENRAQTVRKELEARMNEFGLKLHPDKTKIIYCKDFNRRNPQKKENIEFTFLGFSFRPRGVRAKFSNEVFDGFLPGVSEKALNKMRQIIRSDWKIRRKIHWDINTLAKFLSPQIRGWFNNYGRFFKSAMSRIVIYINQKLMKWPQVKFKIPKRKSGGGATAQILSLF